MAVFRHAAAQLMGQSVKQAGPVLQMLRSNHLVQTVRTTLKWEKSQFSRM